MGVAQKFGAVPSYSHTLYSPEKSYMPAIQTIPLYVHSFSRNFPLEFRVGVANSQSNWGRGGRKISAKFPRVYTRTKRYCSFINYALNNYQDKPQTQ